MKTKKCSVCGETLSLENFNIGNYTSAGNPVYRGVCKSCQSEKDKLARKKRLNRKPVKTKFCPDCQKELDGSLFNLNRGSTTGLSTYCKSCSKERDKIAKSKRSYKDKHSFNEMKRYSKKKKLVSDLTIDEWNYALSYFNNKCVYCGVEFDDNIQPEYEHFIPISKNGGFTVSNIIPSCKSCNASKNNKDYDEWSKIKGLPPHIKHNIYLYFDKVRQYRAKPNTSWGGVETVIDYPTKLS